jgi:hypothetical protein
MTTFDNREKGFENKFAHDAELGFKAQARAVKQLCLWAAGETGKTGDEAVDYAKGRMAGWLTPGSGDVVALVAADIAAVKSTVTEAAVRAKFGEFMSQAQKQLLEEG